MRLAQDAKDIRAQIVFLNNAAYAVFRCIGDFKRAEKCVTRAIHLVAEAGPLENSAIYYDTMASILLEKGDYESALRWARQARAFYRSWEGHFNFVGNDIDFHLGLAYLRTKQLDRAGPLLQRVVANWARSSDTESEIQGLTALAEFYLERREYTHALECVRKVEKLLRKTDGLEQIQSVYWIQFRVFQSVGAEAAAKRALLRAHSAVLSQADALKGRFRRRFLDLVSINKLILRQVEVSALIRKGSERVAVPRRVSGDPAIRIAERRRAVLALVTARELRQKEIAARLGVSVRTVRCDLTALRNQGVVNRGC
jgi:tetratricopeptide (TPR) repeat protein